MTDGNRENGADKSGPPVLRARIVSQCIRDLSFENFLRQRGGKQHGELGFQVTMNVEGTPLEGGEFESLFRLQIAATEKESKESIYYLELEYSGVFIVDGLPQEQSRPFMLVECPRLLFPFVRRIVHDVTHDGGFDPFGLELIDFNGLYQAELARRSESESRSD